MTAHVNLLSRVQATAKNSVRLALKASHNGFALLGLALAFVVIGLSAQPELRRSLEFKATAWLQDRQFAFLGMEARADAVERATAVDPKDLPRQQAAVAYWLSTKYRVAPEPLAALVAEAYQIGAKAEVEPVLLLAIMAIESGFNPFAQSPMGAQGLMQVMTKVHVDKYEGFGGAHAAFDPVTNLRVGARVLEDCISRRGGTEGGLRCYVGATSTISDGGYVSKVMAEFNRLKQVANGKSVPTTAPALQVAVAAPAPSATPVSVAPTAAAIVSPNTLPAPTVEQPAAKPTAENPLPSAKAAPQAKGIQVASRDTASEQKSAKPQSNGLNARGIPEAIAPFMMMPPPAQAPIAKPGGLDDKTKLATNRVS